MNDLEVYQPRGEVAVREPHRDIDSWIQVVSDVIKIANVICDTPFVPDGLRGSAPAVAAAILCGREMGLGMMTSLANIDVIRGKPIQKPLLMRAMILERGHKWIDVDVTDFRAVVRGCRKGESEWTEVTFTAEQAKKAGLNLGNYPADKLYARASSRLAKRKFADVIMGMPYTPDDIEDGVADDEIGTVTEVTAQPAAIEQPKPRTAQRRTRTQTAPPAQAATPPAAAARPPSAADAGGALPPLPGEEEERPTAAADAGVSASTAAPAPAQTAQPDDTGDDSPTSDKHRALVGIVQQHFKRLGFGDGRRAERLEKAAQIAGTVNLLTLNDLDNEELSTVADTLARCKNDAALTALLEAAQAEGAADGGASDGQ